MNRPLLSKIVLILCFILTSHIIMIQAQDDPTNEIDQAIEACRDTPEPDFCLASIVLTEGETHACFAARDVLGCGEIVMEFVAPGCETAEDPQACFRGLGAEGLEAACDYLDEGKSSCYIQAGAVSADYTVVERRFAEGDERDSAYAMLAVTAYDGTVLPLIEDNEKHDLAYIYTMVVIAIGQDVTYDANYCDGLRGNYDSEYPEDADLNAALCIDAVNLVTVVQALEGEDLDKFMEELRTALEAPNADEALSVLLQTLLEQGEKSNEQQIIIEQGEQWCYQDSTNIGTCSTMLWVVYDPATNTLNEVFEYVGNNTYEATDERERRRLVDGEVVVETYVVVIQMIVINERLIERHNIFPDGRIDIDIFTLDY